jgi:chromosome segregation ATPase
MIVKKPKPIAVKLTEQIEDLTKENKKLLLTNKLLEQRVTRIERALSKLLASNRLIFSKHGHLREHVKYITTKVESLNTRKSFKI